MRYEILPVLFFCIASLFGEIPSDTDKLYVYSEIGGEEAPMAPVIDVWEGTCRLKLINNDSSPEEKGNVCLGLTAKPKNGWWGIGIRAMGGMQDLSEYKYLVASLKSPNYKSDFYIGFQSVEGYPKGHVKYRVKREVLKDREWHQVYFDISDKTAYLAQTNILFFVWNVNDFRKGKIFIDNVYFSKTKPEPGFMAD